MFLNSATFKASSLERNYTFTFKSYGARVRMCWILGEKNICDGLENIPPPPNDGRVYTRKSKVELVTILLEICDSQNYDISYEI